MFTDPFICSHLPVARTVEFVLFMYKAIIIYSLVTSDTSEMLESVKMLFNQDYSHQVQCHIFVMLGTLTSCDACTHTPTLDSMFHGNIPMMKWLLYRTNYILYPVNLKPTPHTKCSEFLDFQKT